VGSTTTRRVRPVPGAARSSLPRADLCSALEPAQQGRPVHAAPAFRAQRQGGAGRSDCSFGLVPAVLGDQLGAAKTAPLMPSGRLCRDGVTRMHVFPAQEEIDLAVTRHNRRPIANLHHLRRGSYWRSATVMKRAGDRGELTPNPSCVRQWQMRPYLSAAQSRAAAASHLRWRSSRPSQQCVLLCRVARHAKSR
jgi:hypothetical protein